MATKGLWLWKFAKLGVVGGAVYFTVVTGVWDRDTKQVQSLMEQALGREEEKKEQKVKQELSWESRWNNGTQKVFKYLANVPEKTKENAYKAGSKTIEFFKS